MLKTIIIAACVCFAAFTGYRIYEKRDAVTVTIPIVARPDVVPPVVIRKPDPVREQAPSKKKTERERDPVREHVKPKIKPTHVEVNRGTLKPAYSCATLKGYVDTYGKSLVRSSAPAYGYSLEEVDGALKACGLI